MPMSNDIALPATSANKVLSYAFQKDSSNWISGTCLGSAQVIRAALSYKAAGYSIHFSWLEVDADYFDLCVADGCGRPVLTKEEVEALPVEVDGVLYDRNDPALAEIQAAWKAELDAQDAQYRQDQEDWKAACAEDAEQVRWLALEALEDRLCGRRAA